MKVKRTERGWAGHYICANYCRFRRNTLLEYGNKKWVISTVGNCVMPNVTTSKIKLTEIGCDRYYETMAFVAKDDKYNDADVFNEIEFDSEWGLFAGSPEEFIAIYPNADNNANEMHEKVVEELMIKIQEDE